MNQTGGTACARPARTSRIGLLLMLSFNSRLRSNRACLHGGQRLDYRGLARTGATLLQEAEQFIAPEWFAETRNALQVGGHSKKVRCAASGAFGQEARHH